MEPHLCTYCADLETLDRSRRGTKSRCPLCKSDLLRTDSGTTYRIPEGLDLAAAPNRGRAIAWALATAVVLLAALGVWLANASRPTPTTAPAIGTAPTSDGPVAIERAVFKSGQADVFVGL